MTLTTSVDLLERLRQPSDREAWSRFARLYTPLLYVWVRGMGLQEADAADLVQDLWVHLNRKLPDFVYDKDKGFRNWLRTVTQNKVREFHRTRKDIPHPDPSVLNEIPTQDSVTASELAEYQSYLVQQAMTLLKDEFPASTWDAFRQYVVAGRSPEEVAAELGLKVGTVYGAKSRVLSRLREELRGLI